MSKVPLRPLIVTSTAVKCGSAIKITWVPPSPEAFITQYEIILKSTREEEARQSANLSSSVMSYEFVGLSSNQFYEVSLRARNSEGFSTWTTEQLTTTAGMIKKRKCPALVVALFIWLF